MPNRNRTTSRSKTFSELEELDEVHETPLVAVPGTPAGRGPGAL